MNNYSDDVLKFMEDQGIVIDAADTAELIEELDNPKIPREMMSLARTCNQETCEHRSSCPLIKKGINTNEKKCPLDLADIAAMVKGLDEYMVKMEMSNDIILMDRVKDLIFAKLTLSRMEALIADDGYFTDVPIPMDKSGLNIEYVSEVSQVYLIREKMMNEVMRISKFLGVDRYSKFKIDAIKQNISLDQQLEEQTKMQNHMHNVRLIGNILKPHEGIIDKSKIIIEDTDGDNNV
jgi:hypothetical protein